MYTVARVFMHQIGLQVATGHPALYYSIASRSESVGGAVVTKVDDILDSGSTSFDGRNLRMEDTSDSKPRESPPLSFGGFRISHVTTPAFLLYQRIYARHLQLRQRDATLESYRSLRHQLALKDQGGSRFRDEHSDAGDEYGVVARA